MYVSRLFATPAGLTGFGSSGSVVAAGVSSSQRFTAADSFSADDIRTSYIRQIRGFPPSPELAEALSVEGAPLIDLRTMTFDKVRANLFYRSARALAERNRLTYFRGGDIADEYVRDAAFMATRERTPIQFFLRRSGWPEWSVRHVTHRVVAKDYSGDYLDYCRNVRDSLRHLPRDHLELFLAVYLEMAFHVRMRAAQNLTVVETLMDLLNLSWNEAIGVRDALASPYEKELVRTLREEGGSVPFELYFQYAMYDPSFGVYSSDSGTSLIGQQGFFSTCSERPAFGKVMARALCDFWLSLGKPSSFEAVEMGGGNGTLARNILEEIDDLARHHPVMAELKSALRYRLVETSPALARKQREALAPFGSRTIVQEGSALSLRELPEIENGVFLSNELVDMFPPTHLVEWAGSAYETWISGERGVLQETLRPLSRETRDFLSEYGIGIEGASSYWFHRDMGVWMSNLRSRLKRGYVMTIDYGGPRVEMLFGRSSGSFRMMRGYRSSGSLRELLNINVPDALVLEYNNEPTGMFLPKDLTTDVDFTTLEATAAKAGFAASRLIHQGDFLRGVLNDSPVPSDGVDTSSLDNFHDLQVSLLKTG